MPSWLWDSEPMRRQSLYDIRELLRVADAVDMPREALLPLVLGRPDVTLVAADGTRVGAEKAGAAAVDRRSFHGLAAGVALGGIAPGAAAPDRVDMAHVRYLRAGLGRLRTGYQDVGGGAVLAEARGLFFRAKSMLDDSDYTGSVGRELLVVAAEIGEVAGWAAYDQDDARLSRRLYTEAEQLASASDNAEVSMHAYTNMAQLSTHIARSTGQRGPAREALRFLDRAAEVVRHEPSPKLHALVALRASDAYAELGDERACLAALAKVRRELDRGPHPADPAWAAFVTPAEATGFEASGYEAVARVRGLTCDRASRLYRAVLDDSGGSRRDRTYYRSRLARSLLADGDRTQAIHEGLSVLPDLGERIVSTRVLNELRPVRAAAEKAAAEEFCARFDAAAKALAA
jgi:hypothetical protein